MTDLTDLTGAELDLAVARVMGLRAVITLWPPPCPPPDKYANKRSPACFLPDEDGRMFRPSRGAAAWEVLEWVRREGYEVTFADQDDEPRLVWCSIDVWEGDVGTGRSAYGPTDAIALCRAVVALQDKAGGPRP